MKTTKEKVRDALGKILCEGSETDNTTWAKLKKGKEASEVGVMDDANVCMITPHNKKSYDLMRTINSEDERWSKTPSLQYSHDKGDGDSTSKYSLEYLELFIKLAKTINTTQKSVILKMSIKKDYPLTMSLKGEGYEYSLILAPKVGDE